MPVTIAGELASIRSSYHTAAELMAWTVTANETVTFSARVVTKNTYWLSQQPLVFVVRRQGGVSWRWPILSLQMMGASLSGTLGPKES